MSDTLSPLLIGKNDTFEAVLLPALGNRHGLITGATGTGKTVTLQRLAEQFSAIGVPVFMADVKGDLTGISQPGQMSPKLQTRLEQHGLPTPQFTGFPVTLWDVYGKQGHPVRATISDMGPLLLSRMLGLNDTQEGVLNLTFKVADDNGLLLLDSKDLRAMLQYVGENAKQFTNQYGNVSSASIGAIQRNLLTLEQQGAERFFGEPMLKLSDMMRTAPDGRGVINILMADQLMNAPKLYGTFLLWLLSELFEQLPEVGDQPKPKMVFFFDEAHLLFDDAPKALLARDDLALPLRIYLSAALQACEGGVARSHIVPFAVDGSVLLEFFLHDGVGTMVVEETLEALREATIDDVGGILALIQPLEADGTLVKRDRALIEAEIGNFTVIEHDQVIFGCAAMYAFPEERMAEMACLAVNPTVQSQGDGERLLQRIEQRAREAGITRLFVLTTRTAHWFLKRGFVMGSVDDLPGSRRNLYNWQRRSQVLLKTL